MRTVDLAGNALHLCKHQLSTLSAQRLHNMWRMMVDCVILQAPCERSLDLADICAAVVFRMLEPNRIWCRTRVLVYGLRVKVIPFRFVIRIT